MNEVTAEYRWEGDIFIGKFTLPDDEGVVEQYLMRIQMPENLLVDVEELKQAVESFVEIVDAPVDAKLWELLANRWMKTENGVLIFTANTQEGDELRALATDWMHYSRLKPEDTSQWVFSEPGSMSHARSCPLSSSGKRPGSPTPAYWQLNWQ